MRRPLDLSPPPRRRDPYALAASVALHGLVVLVGMILLAQSPRSPRRDFIPSPTLVSSVAIDMPYAPPRAESSAMPRPATPARSRAGSALRAQRPARVPGRAAAPTVSATRVRAAALPSRGADTAVARAPVPHTGPAYASGRLWVTPLPLPPAELAERITGKSRAQLMDSAITVAVQAFLDSLDADPNAHAATLPSWTTTLGGKAFGVDSKYIYVAGLKIPAIVLGLLKLPQGNVEQAFAQRRLMDMRADLMYAAQRSANMAEFKEAIKEIRKRKEQEEEFRRNQRIAPSPDTAQEP